MGLGVVSRDNGIVIKHNIIMNFRGVSIKFAIFAKFFENLCHFCMFCPLRRVKLIPACTSFEVLKVITLGGFK